MPPCHPTVCTACPARSVACTPCPSASRAPISTPPACRSLSFPSPYPTQDLLLDALASRLIASGWRCHILDAFWLRLVRLADARSRQLALAGGGAGAARELRRALERAVALYYQHGGSGDNGRAADEGGGHGGSAVPAASVLQLLDAALAASTLEHRPPASAATLSRLEQPPLEQQFRPLAGRELPPLRRACDFGALPADVLAALDSAPEGPPLEEVGRCVLQ